MIELAKYIPWLPALGAVLCGLCCLRKSLRGYAALIAVAGVGAAFVFSVLVAGELHEGSQRVHGFEWINVGGRVLHLASGLTLRMPASPGIQRAYQQWHTPLSGG